MSTHVFFNLLWMGPLQGSKVKIRGHVIAHRTLLSPRTNSFMSVTQLHLWHCVYYYLPEGRILQILYWPKELPSRVRL